MVKNEIKHDIASSLRRASTGATIFVVFQINNLIIANANIVKK